MCVRIVLWLVFIAVVGHCSGGCVTVLAAHQKIRAHGGGVAPDDSDVDFDENPAFTDHDLAAVTWALREVQPLSLGLDGTKVTDKAFDTVLTMRGLEQLTLGETAVTPEGVDSFLRRAPKSFKAIGVPNHWDKDPLLRLQLEGLIRAHREVEVNLFYFNGHYWSGRKMGEEEEYLD